jgi:hypothetical protein
VKSLFNIMYIIAQKIMSNKKALSRKIQGSL